MRSLFGLGNDSLPAASCPPRRLSGCHIISTPKSLNACQFLTNNKAGVKIIAFVVPAHPLPRWRKRQPLPRLVWEVLFFIPRDDSHTLVIPAACLPRPPCSTRDCAFFFFPFFVPSLPLFPRNVFGNCFFFFFLPRLIQRHEWIQPGKVNSAALEFCPIWVSARPFPSRHLVSFCQHHYCCSWWWWSWGWWWGWGWW